VLRNQVLKGSAYLALREGIGTAVSLGGMLLLTRTIGPESYGVYAAAFAVLVYLIGLSELGLGVYLIRSHEEQGDEAFHQAFTLLLLQSAAFVGLTIAALPLLARLIRLPGLERVALALVLGLPIVHVVKVPMARLEHALEYKRVAGIELAGQLGFYVAALPLAFQGAGVWAPVGGWWLQHIIHLVLVYRTGYRPRLVWNPPLIRAMLRYGVGYSVSLWIVQLREFVNPVIVGRFLGPAAVGYVALAIRIIDSLGFVKVATARISIAALARLQGSTERIGRALGEGTVLQVLAVGPLLVGFAIAAPIAVPIVFGDEWLPMLDVYPLIAIGYLAGAMFTLHGSALVVLQRNVDVAVANFVNTLVLAGAAWLLIPRLGVAGYGWAEVAAVPTYVALHLFLARRDVRPRYAHAVVWFLASALPLLAGRQVWLAWPALLLPLLYAPMRAEVRAVADVVLKRVRPSDAAPGGGPAAEAGERDPTEVAGPATDDGLPGVRA
jgi:PST family polysaccharide transporter